MNMKNTFGTSVAVTLFGESHGEYIGATIDGLAPGIEIHHEYISHMLTQRRPAGKISTPRKEKDEYKIVFEDKGDISAALHKPEQARRLIAGSDAR